MLPGEYWIMQVIEKTSTEVRVSPKCFLSRWLSPRGETKSRRSSLVFLSVALSSEQIIGALTASKRSIMRFALEERRRWHARLFSLIISCVSNDTETNYCASFSRSAVHLQLAAEASFLPSFLPFFLPSFRPSFLPSFLPSFSLFIIITRGNLFSRNLAYLLLRQSSLE